MYLFRLLLNMFNVQIKLFNPLKKFSLIYFLIYLFFFINIKLAFANEDEFSSSMHSDVISINKNHVIHGSLNNKIHYPEYRIEVILFSNSFNKNKQLLSIFDSKDLNKNGAVDFQLKAVKPKFLLNAYDKLNKEANYKILYYGAMQYSLLPSQKMKKFFISSKNKHNNNYNNQDNMEDFAAILVINKNKNVFNIMFDSIVNKSRLKKVFKLKSKEIYYFDHPMFGALITIISL